MAGANPMPGVSVSKCKYPSLILTLILWSPHLAGAQRVEIRDTEMHKLKANGYKQPFEVDVFLPKNYRTSKKTYPLVLVLDAEYNFGMTSYVTRRLIKNKDIPEVILVGIAYDEDYETFYKNRGRDLTPTQNKQFLPSGSADKFTAFIKKELLPFVESKYRVKSGERTVVGHSFGGLYGYYVLFNHPDLFFNYLLVSPSLWWDKNVIFTHEKSFADQHNDLAANVFTSIGDGERYMVDDLKYLVSRLQGRKYKNLNITMKVHEDENHRSVFPTAFTKGMRSIFTNEVPK